MKTIKCILSSLFKSRKEEKEIKEELIQGCEQFYIFLQNQGRENSLIGQQIKLTIEKATRK